MKDNAGKMMIADGRLCESAEYGSFEPPSRQTVYEVIRIINKTPIFLEDHYDRLVNSMALVGMKTDLSFSRLRSMIAELTDANGLENCNVKLLVFGDNPPMRSMLYISRSYYPSEYEYENGMPAGLFQRTRINPNVKVSDSGYKEAVAEKIARDGVFEVLLVNEQGYVTEGSRSNLFAVRGCDIFTAPDSHVLKGVTRRYVIEACSGAGYNVIFKMIHVDELKDLDALFISGTSINVLPVSEVEGMVFRSAENSVVRNVMKEFSKILSDYIERNRPCR